MAMHELWDAEPGYLNTASVGLPPRSAYDALAAAMVEWRAGRAAWESWHASVDGARECLGRLVGVSPDDIATGGTVAELLGLVAAALPDDARVVVPDCEFSSNLVPWLLHADRGVEVVTVPLRDLAGSIDSRTTLVAFSVVQSATGEVADIDSILASARHHGALVSADATQACGWFELDAGRFDVMAVHAYKWLMSPRGTAFLYASPEMQQRMRPLFAGWYAGANPFGDFYGPPLRLAADARRFSSSPSWLSWVAARPALETVESLGVAAIGRHDVGLANRMRAGLGMPAGDSAVVVTSADGAAERLERAGIRASVRAGNARLAFHAYNTEEDVDVALEALVR